MDLGVNYETLILYFMSILPRKMNFMKIKRFYVIFTNFTRLFFDESVKRCYGNIVNDILTKADVNNDP